MTSCQERLPEIFRRSLLEGQLVPEKPQDAQTVVQESAKQIDIPPYDTSKYALGDICVNRHDYHGTGQSLRQLVGKHECVECTRARKRMYKKRQRQAKRQG
jgi:hypothetical protein